MKKIAVTYSNGEVFQHFGKCEAFKIYEVEGTEVLKSYVVESMGVGHSALANLLDGYDINVLICGGIGDGAQAALADCGIEICSGASGETDIAVAMYLNGELESAGVNCDHHDHEHEEEGCDCGSDCGGDCGSGCGGGCGGCHPPRIVLEGKNAGKIVRTHYRGTFNDGTVFDSSYERNEPLQFICGAGQMIPGYDKAVVDMEVGQAIDIHLMPEDAYGMPNPANVLTIEIASMPGSEELNVGDRVALLNPYGQQIPVTVTAKDDVEITFDANHEMAGKELNFHIELVEIVE